MQTTVYGALIMTLASKLIAAFAILVTWTGLEDLPVLPWLEERIKTCLMPWGRIAESHFGPDALLARRRQGWA
jgi:hypothetical protein